MDWISNGIVHRLKTFILVTKWIFVYYKPICGYSDCVLCNCRWQTDGVVLTLKLDDSKDCLL